MRPAFHSILIHLATGPLILAFLVVTFRFWLRPRGGWPEAIWRAADPVALYSILFGCVTLLLTFASGLLLWPLEAALNSPIAKNKMLMGLLAIVCWYGWLALRLRVGVGIWNRGAARGHLAYMLCFAGTMYLVSTNSVGGDLAGIPSGYEAFAEAAGFRTRHALYFPSFLNAMLWMIGIAAMTTMAIYGRRQAASPGHAPLGRFKDEGVPS